MKVIYKSMVDIIFDAVDNAQEKMQKIDKIILTKDEWTILEVELKGFSSEFTEPCGWTVVAGVEVERGKK